MPTVTRRNFISISTGALALAAAQFPVVDLHAAPRKAKSKNSPEAALDTFIGSYMHAMNSPGMTLGMANRNEVVRVAAFGFSDIELKEHVDPNQLFHIGSITKSFVALVLLQLREEGKVDFERPILEYLPWLPIEDPFGPITTHHLLTHTSGLPDALTLFPSDRTTKWQQGYKPGEHFYYSNLAFDILGHLIEALDGRSWPSSVKARVLDRVGMTATTPNITNEARPKTAKSYVPYYEDRPYPRMGKLGPIGNVQFDDAAGSIASTAHDMALYSQMLLNKGKTSSGRVISEESFALMSKPYVKADEFGPTASYGYGIAVDTLDGHKVLRHTGGMPSFASAILLDLDAGVGAFASINAMQGYRPTQVVQYAVQIMNAGPNPKTMPTAPTITDPNVITNASDYIGSYITPDGKRLDISGDKQLFASIDGRHIPLQHAEGDTFIADDAQEARYPFTFVRARAPEAGKSQTEAKSDDKTKPEEKPKPQPVTELIHGLEWYRNDRYTGPIDFKVPESYKALAGYYLGAGPFPAEAEIFVRKGELWMGDDLKLVPIGENVFVPEDRNIPERLEFLYVVGGKARLVKFAGMDLWRFERT